MAVLLDKRDCRSSGRARAESSLQSERRTDAALVRSVDRESLVAERAAMEWPILHAGLVRFGSGEGE